MNIQALVNQNNNICVGDKAKSFPDRKAVAVKFACPICEELYDTHEEAAACANQEVDFAGIKVGDIVIIPSKRLYYWEEGFQTHWRAFTMKGDPSAGSHFDHDDSYVPYYVVTAIHGLRREPHRVLVTVCSLISGQLCAGWNPIDGDGHDAMFLPGRPREEQHSDVGSSWWDDVQSGVRLSDQVLKAKPSQKLLNEASVLADMKISSDSLL